jgi:hypothetical protein
MAIAALRYDGPKYVLLSTPPADAQTIDTGVPFTNADHIRSMTDEELAKFSAYQMSRRDCWGCTWFWPCDYEKETCTKFFLDWLKQPYKEDT